MHVGVPACRQRQLQMMGQTRAQHPHLAGTCNVNQIRLEPLHNLADQGNVPQKCGIEAKVFFQGKRQKAPRQLKRPNIVLFQNRLRPVAGPHTQERQIPPPRKRLKVPAGMRNPVHLVKRVGKVRHPRHSCTHRFVGTRSAVPLRTPARRFPARLSVVLAQCKPQLVRLAPRHAQAA